MRVPNADDDFSHLAGFCDGVVGVDAAEVADRRVRLQKEMKKEELALWVCEAGLHCRYLSEVRWGVNDRPLLYLVSQNGETFWVVARFEAERLAKKIGGEATILTYREHESPVDVLCHEISRRAWDLGNLGTDPYMRNMLAQQIRAKSSSSRDGSAAILNSRVRKTSKELARIRRANLATKESIKAAAQRLKPGMKQSDFSKLIHKAQADAGLENIWSLVLFGPNAAFPHGTPEDRALSAGDIVLVDTGGFLHGFGSDITRSWAPMGLAKEAQKAYETVLLAQTAAMQVIAPGVRCGDVDRAARRVMARAGYGEQDEFFTHRLGHGIGYQLHEDPYLVSYSNRVLEVGMTMSNEPGIYVPGKFGIRIEDIIAVSESGVEIFGPRAECLARPFGS